MALYLRYAVRSDLGLVRNNNEDSVYAGPRLLAIADGMGGHAAGEVASKIVITTLEHLDEDRRIDDLMAELRHTVIDANHRIAAAVQHKNELEGMGTTLTALRFVGSQVGLVHVGDSRAYLMRGGVLDQITHDDTYVQYLVDTGKLTPDEAKDHPRKSVILRALLGADVEPDVSIREAFEGDRYLLCSDGLSDVVSTETIADTLFIDDPQESADRLVELALRGGGPDNVTVIVADVLNAKVGDTVDDVPVIAGAFVDPAAADIPTDESGADSAAERAARMARPTTPADAPGSGAPPTRNRKRSWRSWFLGSAIVLVLVAVLAGVYAWTQTQHFVGRDGQNVAIFRGVNTAFGPVKLYSVDEVAAKLKFDALCPSDRARVQDGIDASSKTDAQRIVDQLRQNRRSSCPLPHRCPHTSAVPPGSAGATGVPSEGAGADTRPGRATKTGSTKTASKAGSTRTGSSKTVSPGPAKSPNRSNATRVDERGVGAAGVGAASTTSGATSSGVTGTSTGGCS